jgi:hypothetical protein
VDSAFQHTQLDSALVDELELSAAASGETFNIVLGLGGLDVPDPAAVAWDGADMGMGGDSPRGRLGLSVFSDYLLTLDFPNRELILERGELGEANGDDVLDYSASRSDDPDDPAMIPAVPMLIDGEEFTVQLHTGTMGELQLHTDLIDVLSLKGKPGRVGRVRSGDQEADILATALNASLVIGGGEVIHPSIFFSDLFITPGAGAEVFSYFAVTFDQANERIRFNKPEGIEDRLFEAAVMMQDLAGDPVDLREAFNRDLDKTRMLLILSPT